MTAQGRPGTTFSSLHQSQRWFISNHSFHVIILKTYGLKKVNIAEMAPFCDR
jgi:hypothetical protein